jgi:Rieske 2Fe-2S family protein
MHASHPWLDRLQACEPGYGLPREFYGDPVLFDLELQAIHYRDWLFVGHSCELPKPGAFMTVQIGAYPILLVRDAEQQIHAFHNACRHRGSRVCTAARGSAPRLVCPYHQWSYGLDGHLISARQMPPGIDRTRLALKPVHCESVAGYLFVCVAEQAPQFAPFRDLIGPAFGPHRLEEAKVAFETTIVERGNWKMVWENNRECYHCRPNHPELCRSFSDAPSVTGVPGASDDPVLVEHWRRLEALGLPSSFRLSDNGQCRTTRVPLASEALSYTLSGHAAVRRPLCPSLPARDFGALLCFHYPSTWNHVLADHAVSFRVLPISPTETELTTKWLVHRDAVEGQDYDLGELTAVWQATNAQDQRIVEENQRGVSSPAYEPGPFSPEHEGGVRQFLEWYRGAMVRGLDAGARIGLTHVA